VKNTIKKKKVKKIEQVCWDCGETYGKDNGGIYNAQMNKKCDICNQIGITVNGAKFAPFDLNKKEEGKQDGKK